MGEEKFLNLVQKLNDQVVILSWIPLLDYEIRDIIEREEYRLHNTLSLDYCKELLKQVKFDFELSNIIFK